MHSGKGVLRSVLKASGPQRITSFDKMGIREKPKMVSGRLETKKSKRPDVSPCGPFNLNRIGFKDSKKIMQKLCKELD